MKKILCLMLALSATPLHGGGSRGPDRLYERRAGGAAPGRHDQGDGAQVASAGRRCAGHFQERLRAGEDERRHADDHAPRVQPEDRGVQVQQRCTAGGQRRVPFAQGRIPYRDRTDRQTRQSGCLQVARGNRDHRYPRHRFHRTLVRRQGLPGRCRAKPQSCRQPGRWGA